MDKRENQALHKIRTQGNGRRDSVEVQHILFTVLNTKHNSYIYENSCQQSAPSTSDILILTLTTINIRW